MAGTSPAMTTRHGDRAVARRRRPSAPCPSAHDARRLETFVRQIGYDPILFEKGDIPFHHDTLLEQSCLQEVESADMLVLIIGGRFGSLSKEDRELLEKDPQRFFGKIRSVTQKEYEKARERDIPVFAFVDSQVIAEYATYKANRDKSDVNYAFVDSVKIYELIDDIYSQRRNNYLKEFGQLYT